MTDSPIQSKVSLPQSDGFKTAARRLAIVFACYFVIALLFHSLGVNLFHQILGGGDSFTAGYPAKLFATRLSAWNPYVQLGQYSFANTQFQPFYPPALLLMAILPDTFGYNLFLLLHYALAGTFFYCFARQRELQQYAAAVGGLIFMLSGFLSAHKGHQAMMTAAVWLPAMLLFIDRSLDRRRRREIAFLAIVFAMSILAGFPQVTVYSLLLAAGYCLFRSTAGRPWRLALRSSIFLLAAAGALSLLLSSLQLFAVAEALPQMTREKLTYEMFSEDYFPIYHVLQFFFPNALGGLFGTPTYSAELNFVEAYPYIGLAPLLLLLLALRYCRREYRDVVFWAAALAAAFLLALGPLTPLHALMFGVPVYNLFRAPARHLLEMHMAIAALAAIGLDFILRASAPGSAPLRVSLKRASILFLSAFAVAYVICQGILVAAQILSAPGVHLADGYPVNGLMTMGTAKAVIIRNLSPSQPTVLYPCLFMVLAVMLIYLLGRTRRWTLAALPVVIAADMYIPYATLYANPDTSTLGRPASRPETQFLQAQRFDASSYRLYPLDPELTNTYPLLNITYGWPVVNDYTPMWLKRYVAVTDFALNGVSPAGNLKSPNAMAAAGAQYLITKSPEKAAILAAVEPLPRLTTGPIAVAPFAADHAAAIAPGRFRLQSTDGSAVSMVMTPVPLRPSTIYRITFETTAPSGIAKPLLINLYAEGYDNPAQYKVYTQLPLHSARQTMLIDSGPAAPKQAVLRVFTQSTTPVDIGDIQVSETTPEAGGVSPGKIYDLVYKGNDGVHIFRSRIAQPRFRFVTTLRPSNSPEEARTVLETDPAFDVASAATVEGLAGPITVEKGEILGKTVRDGELQFTVRTGQRSFFVVGDSWFPGWKARVDGKDTPIYPVDGFLRGIMIEGAGAHEIVMSYHPWSVPAGFGTTGLGIVIAGLLLRTDRRARTGAR